MSRDIRVIEARHFPALNKPFFRSVAAYARVSTSSEDQMNSVRAQEDYYTSLIMARADWKLYGIYADEGISGLGKERRPEFNRMIDDALAGKISLIVTKSISRFARNTVDTLTCIRELKAVGCEVFFEKEDLWTFSSNSEFMLTLLSSMAQEESRSISENVTWGHRKRFADGKYSVGYGAFLGYNHGMVINPEQAKTVRIIYRLFFQGYSTYRICKYLMANGILSPNGHEKWCASVVKSILTNEKYKGDALLQKKFTVDYLTKTMKTNEGELPQYYVTDGHKAIIPRETFDYVQSIFKSRMENIPSEMRTPQRFSYFFPLSGRIICPICDGIFGISTGHGDRYWICRNHMTQTNDCHGYSIRFDWIDYFCKKAIVMLMYAQKNSLLSLLRKLSRQTEQNKNDYKTAISFLKAEDLFHLTEYISDGLISILVKQIHPDTSKLITLTFINDWKYQEKMTRGRVKRNAGNSSPTQLKESSL